LDCEKNEIYYKDKRTLHMRIYTRDYSKLTQEEIQEWQRLKEQEKAHKTGSTWITKSLYRDYPKAVRHYMSLFPNNHLDIVDLQDKEKLDKLTECFLLELDNPEANERSIMKFIKDNEAYFIIASILKENYNFGHHDAFIIPEFQLGNSYQVDYLLIGQNSGGYEFVFVELEHPSKNITTANGELGAAFRKGTEQIRDWKVYLQSSYQSLRETFNRYKHQDKQLPDEFTVFDSSRMHYVVVAGRRTNFTHRTYLIKRQMLDEQKVLLLHYDNLYDYAKRLIGQLTY
jgi:hypothetical protein